MNKTLVVMAAGLGSRYGGVKQVEKVGFFGIPKNVKLMDLPGRRSHEYFPRLSPDGKWLVWGATDKGHDHDLFDYELYLWKIGEPFETATRITYNSGNDRWPDIWFGKVPVSASAASAETPIPSAPSRRPGPSATSITPRRPISAAAGSRAAGSAISPIQAAAR